MKKQKSRLDLWRDTHVAGALADVGNFVLFAVRRFYSDRMNQAAGALTYSTLLALVPLLVIAFAVLSGFPAFDPVKTKMQAVFLNILVPEVGSGVQDYLSEFTQSATNLTTVGIVALALTAVLLLSTIESTLNLVWRVERERPISTRLLIFWTILTLGPLLLGASFTLTSDVMDTVLQWARETTRAETAGATWTLLTTLLAILTQSVAFTLLFILVPARRVRLRDAALGGVISGVAFQMLRWGFHAFLTSGSTYTTIYGAVAIFPIFLIWIYLSWTVIILGAVFAASFPDWWRTRDPLTGMTLSPAQRLEVAVALLSVLSRQSHLGGGVSQDRLAETVPLEARDQMIEALRAARYIVNTEDQRLTLSRDLHRTSMADLARDIGLTLGLTRKQIPGQHAAIEHILPKIEKASGALPELLIRLKGAEDDILQQTVAEVIAGQSALAGQAGPPSAAVKSRETP